MAANTQIIIIEREENSRNIIKNYLSEVEDVTVKNIQIKEFFNYEPALENIPTTEKCIIFLDTSDEIEKSIEFIKTIKKHNKEAFIIALSNKTSTETIIKVMRAGAKEFLTKPIIKTEFNDVIKNVFKEIENTEPVESCKIISTFSNKGGIGKTSIAVNLAVELAQMSKEKVALIDLNLQLGDVATFLDMTPAFAMDYIAKNIQNLDESELLKSLSRYKNTSLYVIADPLNIDKSQEITAEEIKNILTALKKTFSYIVIDIGTNIDSKTITALDLSDLILLIAIVNLPAIRSTQRCMELFDRLGYKDEKIKLVLNRYMENEEIKTSDIEEVVKQKVYWKIPNNYLTMMSAINKGVPVNAINAESNIGINYKEFASKLSDYLITQTLNKNYNNKNTINI
ncbi:MAG: AAA family ATPase [Clostridium sp.]|nr:AAA family ATPase [Clostridium sp.]